MTFKSVVREANLKQGAPFAGFPVEGCKPLAIRRKLLQSAIVGLDTAIVEIRFNGKVPYLRIESIDGGRRYSFWSRNESDVREVRKETFAYAKRKAGSVCRKVGWKRVTTFAGDSLDPDGTIVVNDSRSGNVTAYVKAGLRIVGNTVYHAASGKTVIIAPDHNAAFVAAEKAFTVYDQWEQDAESLLTALGPERRKVMVSIQSECRYGQMRRAA